jgi:uncharacterized protein (DUF1800 family)
VAMPAEDLVHLLRRTEFVARPDRVVALAAKTRVEAVDDILNVGLNTSQSPPANLTAVPTNGWQQYVDSCNWWLGRMVGMERPFLEKMVLFWHGHFVSAWWDVDGGYRLMRQLQTYRANALGQMVTLTQAMAVDSAMLVYLSNADNVKRAPNENFARELMELFLLGANNGYTQTDVQNVARAWTGHNAPWDQNEALSRNYLFRPNQHDYDVASIFGLPNRPAGAGWNGPEVITEIVAGSKAQLSARYIAKKLWEFLAHPGPPAAVLDAVAPVFAADHDIKNLARNILLRDEFYLPAAKQGLVRTPIEFFAALCYHSPGMTADDLGVSWGAESTGQQMFQPPNVSGWRPNGYWLNTSGISGRANIAQRAAWWLQQTGRPFDDRTVISSKSAAAAVDFVATYFGITSLSATTRNAIIAAHQADRASNSYWSWYTVGNLLMMVMLAPEFHMA